MQVFVSHFAGEPEVHNGLPLVGRIHEEFSTQHFHNGLADRESQN